MKKSNKFSLSDNSIENDLTIRLYDTLLHRPINENEQRTRKNRVEKKREKKKNDLFQLGIVIAFLADVTLSYYL